MRRDLQVCRTALHDGQTGSDELGLHRGDPPREDSRLLRIHLGPQVFEKLLLTLGSAKRDAAQLGLQ